MLDILIICIPGMMVVIGAFVLAVVFSGTKTDQELDDDEQ